MNFGEFLDKTAAILLQPSLHFKREEDGFAVKDGILYAAIMGGLGMAIGGMLGTRGVPSDNLGIFVSTLIIAPLVAVLSAYIMAAMLHLLSHFLGSNRAFSASFGISSAASALYPVTAIIDIVPGIGVLVGLIWSWWIVSQGLSGIHRVDVGSARISVGVVYLVLAVALSLTG